MSFSWSVLRNAPPLSPHGSPMCQATQSFQLAPKTREELVDILEVSCNFVAHAILRWSLIGVKSLLATRLIIAY